MRTILICPFMHTIEEHQVSDDLQSWYKLLTPPHVDWRVDLVQTAMSPFEGVDVLCDEEGLYKPDSPSWLLKGGHPDPIFGRAMLLGFNPKTGDSIDCNVLLTEVQSKIMWMPYMTRSH